MQNIFSKCKYCDGSGYSKRKPEKCLCGKICAKCEKNEGFTIHPCELCDYCCGTGDTELGNLVLCIKKN